MKNINKQRTERAARVEQQDVSESDFGLEELDKPTESLPISKELEFAWAAGFVDGDGCICAVLQRHPDRETPSVRIRLVITQNDHRVLHVLQRVLGEPSALNSVKRQACQNRQPYQLQYDSGHAIAAIKKIRPYLVRKAQEADACMQLFVEGRLNQSPGPKGFPPEVHRIRKYLVNRIRKMK